MSSRLLKPFFGFRCLARFRGGQIQLIKYDYFATQTPRLHQAGRTSKSSSGYIHLTIPVLTFCLGTWQVQRKRWKEGLIKMLEERTQMPVVDLPEDLNLLTDMQYRRVRVRGHFDHSRELKLGPRSNLMRNKDDRGNPTGYNIITPFVLSDRDLTILVNRGWVPYTRATPETRPHGQITEEVEIVGTVQLTQPKSAYIPKSMTDTPDYIVYRDVEEMARRVGAAPVYIDADNDSSVRGGPIGGQTRIHLENRHFMYILTWYSLSFITFIMWYRRFRSPPIPTSAVTYFRNSQQLNKSSPVDKK